MTVREDNLDPTSIRSAGAVMSLAQRIQALKDNSSKVVDENGEPLVVYHDTAKSLDTFDKNKIMDNISGLLWPKIFNPHEPICTVLKP